MKQGMLLNFCMVHGKDSPFTLYTVAKFQRSIESAGLSTLLYHLGYLHMSIFINSSFFLQLNLGDPCILGWGYLMIVPF
jgi:hypothetical protein